MTGLLRRAEAAWLAPAPATRVALVRILLGLFLVTTVVTGWSEVPGLAGDPANRFLPVGAARLLPRPTADTVVALQLALLPLGAAWIAGVAWRVTGPLFAAAFWLWASWRLSWGAIAHDLHLATLHALVLACTPAAAALAIDARRRGPLGWRTAPSSWHHGWSLRLLAVVTACAYFLAGWSKLRAAGLAWAHGDNLLAQLAYATLVRALYDPDAGAPLGITLVREHGWLLSAGSALTLVVEVGAPLALLHRRLAYAWLLGVVAMHVGIAVLMGITFPYQTWGLAFASFLPLERLLPARWGGAPRLDARAAG